MPFLFEELYLDMFYMHLDMLYRMNIHEPNKNQKFILNVNVKNFAYIYI